LSFWYRLICDLNLLEAVFLSFIREQSGPPRSMSADTSNSFSLFHTFGLARLSGLIVSTTQRIRTIGSQNQAILYYDRKYEGQRLSAH